MTKTWEILAITPEPTRAERDAIVAALTVLAGEEVHQEVQTASRWRLAAKLDALRGIQINTWQKGKLAYWNHDPERASSVSRSASFRPDR